MERLFSTYDTILVVDTETTGLRPQVDHVIELAAVAVTLREGRPAVTSVYDQLLRLPDGCALPWFITKLTGITESMLIREGIDRGRGCEDLAAMIHAGRTLLAAYNTPFDLRFLQNLLCGYGDPAVLAEADALDVLQIFRRRRPKPHKLCHAISAYGLDDFACNSHRASDDALATWMVLEAMDRECPDIEHYIRPAVQFL